VCCVRHHDIKKEEGKGVCRPLVKRWMGSTPSEEMAFMRYRGVEMDGG
jgi:hypothetical protein